MAFAAALMRARRALEEDGVSSFRLEVHLARAEDVLEIQHEAEVGSAIIEEALHPRLPTRAGLRPIAEVHGVAIYVQEAS